MGGLKTSSTGWLLIRTYLVHAFEQRGGVGTLQHPSTLYLSLSRGKGSVPSNGT